MAFFRGTEGPNGPTGGSLAGTTGRPGPTGANGSTSLSITGPTGALGPIGATGQSLAPTGPQGAQGPRGSGGTGPTGATGTSVAVSFSQDLVIDFISDLSTNAGTFSIYTPGDATYRILGGTTLILCAHYAWPILVGPAPTGQVRLSLPFRNSGQTTNVVIGHSEGITTPGTARFYIRTNEFGPFAYFYYRLPDGTEDALDGSAINTAGGSLSISVQYLFTEF